MHICLISSEFFGLGAAGGFGFATRSLGQQLVARGHQVTVVIPQPYDARNALRSFAGIKVQTFPRRELFKSGFLYKSIDADIYHSQEPSISSFIAQRAVPKARHLVTCQDPRNYRDWWIEFQHPTRTRAGLLRTALYYQNPATYAAVRRASRVFVSARYLVNKVQKKFRLLTAPEFLPTPITMPLQPIEKAERPTLCFVGRLDRRKRPEMFIELASKFPAAEFVVAGSSQNARYAIELEARAAKVPNIHMLGFVDQFQSDALSQLFSRSWILVNTAAREGLPNVFMEAAAHECAILSAHDPDGFSSRFGSHCPDQDFVRGVTNLLCKDRWRTLGMAGAAYVRSTYEARRATDSHLHAYEAILND